MYSLCLRAILFSVKPARCAAISFQLMEACPQPPSRCRTYASTVASRTHRRKTRTQLDEALQKTTKRLEQENQGAFQNKYTRSLLPKPLWDRGADTEKDSSRSAQTLSTENLSAPNVVVLDDSNENQLVLSTEAELESGNQNPSDSEDLSLIRKPSFPTASFNLAPYVTTSETLMKLVKLGTDLSGIERIPGAADFLLKADFESQIRPYIYFLHDNKVPDDWLGHVISKNPLLFQEHLDDLSARVSYLKSKRFSTEAISNIIARSPLILLMPVEKIDSKLGFLQNHFKLKGNEVRAVVTQCPHLIPWHRQKIKDSKLYMKLFLGFSESELTKILLAAPRLFLASKHALGERFDYLHNVMGFDHACLTRWPHVLRFRLCKLEPRHRFLVSLGRAQYDPEKENYVSLQALALGTDSEFCVNVAKTSVQQYNNFLKTL